MNKAHGEYSEAMRIIAAERLIKRSRNWNKYNRPGPYDLSSGPAAVDNAKRLLDKHGVRY